VSPRRNARAAAPRAPVHRPATRGRTRALGLGLAERAFPPPPRQDPLLLDDERIRLNTAAGAKLPLRAAASNALMPLRNSSRRIDRPHYHQEN
jgi:hypothetical protein